MKDVHKLTTCRQKQRNKKCSFLGNLPSLYKEAFIDDLFISMRTFPSTKTRHNYVESEGVISTFSDFTQQNRDIVYHCPCKAGRDRIRIGGRESLGLFSGVWPKMGGSVTSSSEISARATNVFPNTRTVGEDFSNTSSVNCGLQRKDSSEKVVSGCSNTIIGKGEFLNTSSVYGGREILGGHSSFSLVSGGVSSTRIRGGTRYFFTGGNKIKK